MFTIKPHKSLIVVLGLALGGALIYAFLSSRSIPKNPTHLIWPESPDWLKSPEIFGTTVDVKKTKWTLRTLDSVEVQFSDLSGRVVFLNVWATGCVTCVVEMPSIQELRDSLRNEPVAFLIVSDEPLNTLQRFAKRRGLHLPLVQSVSMTPEMFQFQALPTTLILDKTGTVVLAETGGREWNDKNVMKFIRGLY